MLHIPNPAVNIPLVTGDNPPRLQLTLEREGEFTTHIAYAVVAEVGDTSQMTPVRRRAAEDAARVVVLRRTSHEHTTPQDIRDVVRDFNRNPKRGWAQLVEEAHALA